MENEKELCSKCFEKHEWNTFYVEKKAKLIKVNHQEIAWCDKSKSFITRKKIINNIDILPVFIN